MRRSSVASPESAAQRGRAGRDWKHSPPAKCRQAARPLHCQSQLVSEHILGITAENIAQHAPVAGRRACHSTGVRLSSVVALIEAPKAVHSAGATLHMLSLGCWLKC